MNSLTIKRKLAVAIFFSLYILYLSIRLNSISDHLKGYVDYFIDSGVPENLSKRYRANAPIKLFFDPSLSYEKTAERLASDPNLVGSQHFCTKSTINTCSSFSSCASMELKAFIVGYFREQVEMCAQEHSRAILSRRKSAPIPSQYNKSSYGYVYDLVKDKYRPLDAADDKALKTFGVMVGIALITETFLEMKFEDHFLGNAKEASGYLPSLKTLDSEQFDLYLKVAWDTKSFLYRPYSERPFCHYYETGCIEIQNNSVNLNMVAGHIFIEPYEKVRDRVFSGLDLVLGNRLYNFNPHRYFQSNIVISYVFGGSKDYPFNIVSWKRYSRYNPYTLIFWKALNQVGNDCQRKIYTRVTGFKGVPFGGLRRLPRTLIVNGTGNMFSGNFIVKIDPKWSLEDIKTKLIEECSSDK